MSSAASSTSHSLSSSSSFSSLSLSSILNSLSSLPLFTDPPCKLGVNCRSTLYDFAVDGGFALDATVVCVMASVITATYLLLFFTGPMKKRSVQSAWELVFYAALFGSGVYHLVSRHQLHLFFNTPVMYAKRAPLAHMNLYFDFEFAWYISCLICICFNRQKDFWAMVFHHVLVLPMIYFSWKLPDYQTVGLSVMVLHDWSDIFLHFAKFCHYSGWTRITDTTFVIFACTFFVTRLIIFPGIPYGYWVQWETRGYCGATMVIGLMMLVLLHVYWFTFIVRIALRAFKSGNVEGDIRDEEVTKLKKVE